MRPVLWGVGIQLLVGWFVLRTTVGKDTFTFLGKQVEHFLEHVEAGVSFVFGEHYADFYFAFRVSKMKCDFMKLGFSNSLLRLK